MHGSSSKHAALLAHRHPSPWGGAFTETYDSALQHQPLGLEDQDYTQIFPNPCAGLSLSETKPMSAILNVAEPRCAHIVTLLASTNLNGAAHTRLTLLTA